ncbi:hypothetical protein BDV33DRAFT_210699 [Aspergillus novoparasiticus]|uniref:Uncharacterized protein n=1 Tax=Aspergillus novoparasiticus TaxID=986946 RepID=A0A5N6E6D2_9EURO|nr:hypothetical protein BDV33DRAFT_210699 [Aspergillus novoparasiticus]
MHLRPTEIEDLEYANCAGPAQEWEQTHKTPAESLDQALGLLQQYLKEAIDLCRVDQLVGAVELMLAYLDWVTGDAKDCGVFIDNPVLYPRQLLLWNKLNICFLAICQRQKDITEATLKANAPLSPGCLSISQIETLVNELICLSDRIEDDGLVDYEMGFWEEEILSILDQCLSLSNTINSNQLQNASSTAAYLVAQRLW